MLRTHLAQELRSGLLLSYCYRPGGEQNFARFALVPTLYSLVLYQYVLAYIGLSSGFIYFCCSPRHLVVMSDGVAPTVVRH